MLLNKEFNRYEDIEFEDCEILFKNFEGIATPMNNAGAINFNIVLTPEEAAILSEWGFHPSIYVSKYEEGVVKNHIKVNVGFNGFKDPIIKMVDADDDFRTVELTPNRLKELDGVKIKTCDIRCHAYSNKNDGHYTLYLTGPKPSFFVVEGDKFAYKYDKYRGSNEPTDGGFDDPF